MTAPKPFTQWICDSCGEHVTAETGWLEWISNPATPDQKARNFRIVHNTDRCHQHTSHPGRNDNHLHYFTGTEGLQRLLAIADNYGNGQNAIDNLNEFVQLVRRLHIPHFEEARTRFGECAAEDGRNPAEFNGASVAILKAIAEKH